MRHLARTAFILIAVLLFSPLSLAEGAREMTLKEAIEGALEKNLELKIAKLTLENSLLDLERSRLSYDSDTNYKRLSLSLEVAKSQSQYDTARNNIIKGIISDFMEITKKRQAIQANQVLLEVKEIELKQKEELYHSGGANPSDVTEAGLTLEEQKLALYRAGKDLEKLEKNLYKATGIEREVKFKEVTLAILPLDIPLNDLLDLALKADQDLKDKELRHQMAILELERAQLEGKPDMDIDKLEKNKEIAQYRYLQAKEALEDNIQDQVWTLEQAVKTVENKGVELKLAQEGHRQVLTSYEKGFSTRLQLLQSHILLLNAQRDLFAAEADYVLKKLQIFNALGMDGLTLLGGDLK